MTPMRSDTTFTKDGLMIVYGAKGAALYDVARAKVYALNKSAASIIESLCSGKSIEQIVDRISIEEHTDHDAIRSAISEFIDQLIELNLSLSSLASTSSNANDQAQPKEMREIWCELTSRCNLKCLHCYASAGQRKASEDKPATAWINIIHEIAQLNCRHIQLTGGELFLRRDVWQIIDASIAAIPEVEIFSNLTVSNIAEIVRRKDYLSVATTLLGPTSDIHDAITQSKGSFLKTTSAIKDLVKAGVRIRVAVIEMNQNHQHISDTLSLIKSMGVSRYGTDYMRSVGRGVINRKVAPLGPVQSRPRRMTSSSFLYNRNYNPCWAHKIAIEPDGTVIPCIFSRTIAVGNAFHESLISILSSDRLQDLWRITLDQVDVCKDCEFRYSCHDCRPLALYENGGMYAKAPRCSYDPYSGFWSNTNDNSVANGV